MTVFSNSNESNESTYRAYDVLGTYLIFDINICLAVKEKISSFEMIVPHRFEQRSVSVLRRKKDKCYNTLNLSKIMNQSMNKCTESNNYLGES